MDVNHVHLRSVENSSNCQSFITLTTQSKLSATSPHATSRGSNLTMTDSLSCSDRGANKGDKQAALAAKAKTRKIIGSI